MRLKRLWIKARVPIHRDLPPFFSFDFGLSRASANLILAFGL
jgi:hypothetical protein